MTQIPPIGEVVLAYRLIDGQYREIRDWVAQVRIGDEQGVLLWGQTKTRFDDEDVVWITSYGDSNEFEVSDWPRLVGNSITALTQHQAEVAPSSHRWSFERGGFGRILNIKQYEWLLGHLEKRRIKEWTARTTPPKLLSPSGHVTDVVDSL